MNIHEQKSVATATWMLVLILLVSLSVFILSRANEWLDVKQTPN